MASPIAVSPAGHHLAFPMENPDRNDPAGALPYLKSLLGAD
jgi:hypothetical protein